MRNFCRLLALVLLLLTLTSAQSNTVSPAPESKPDSSAAQVETPAPPDSTKLKIVKSVKAMYPFAAEKDHRQGQVIVKVGVNEKGEVESAEVVSGDPIFASAALNAVKKWTFEPFIKNGKPIKVTTRLPFNFAFSNNVKDDPEHGVISLAAPAGSGNTSDQSGDAPGLVRVPASVMQGMLIHKVAPTYPPEARASHVEGTVIMQAVIGKDGSLKDLKVISGQKLLAESAVGAVQQWRYRPYTLNGEPVDVETQITVNYTLSR